jgi:glycerol uptake facilitator-like aquaporin
MMRKFFIAVWLVWFEFVPFEMTIGFIIVYQVCHTGFLCFVRSYQIMTENIVEIFIEVVITLILSLLANYANKDKWTDSAQDVIIGLIIFFIVVVLVSTIGMFLTDVG